MEYNADCDLQIKSSVGAGIMTGSDDQKLRNGSCTRYLWREDYQRWVTSSLYARFRELKVCYRSSFRYVVESFLMINFEY